MSHKFLLQFLFSGFLAGKAKTLHLVASLMLVAYVGLGVCLRLWQTRLIFFPSSVVSVTPIAANLAYQEVLISVASEELYSWWIAAEQPNAPVVLYLHGNGSNLGDLLHQAVLFHQLGLSVLLLDYRGYGRSLGAFPSEISVYEDGKAAWRYLTQQRHIAPEQIFVYGHSLGGAIAIELASRYPNMAGVIVESSFTSMAAMVDELFPYQIFPKRWILTQHFDSLSKVRSLQVPILLIHGTSDQIIPVTMSEELFQVAPEPKVLLIIEGGKHHDLSRVGKAQYSQGLLNFINFAL